MKKLWLLMVVLMLPAEVLAQEQPYRKWDVGGAIGLRFGEASDAVVPAGSWNAGFTRYWTAHLKTSIEVMTAGQSAYVDYSYTRLASRSTSTVTGPAALSATVGYQFLENVFVHPYVVGGLRAASVSERITTWTTGAPYTGFTETGPNRLLTRPVAGGGFKSYFGNGRAFMRSELLMTVDPHGSPHAVLTVGAGVDF